NGFGKLLGSTQVNELGELETPVLLTCTLCVWRAADALVAWLLARPNMERVRSINPVVAETNDGTLNAAIRSRPVRPEHVREALAAAATGPVAEGSVGAGSGTIAFGWKGGIGTSSRRLDRPGYTVGVLAQTNFGGNLTIAGVPIYKLLQPPRARPSAGADAAGPGSLAPASPHGSCMLVVATDAPLDARDLRRLAARAVFGLARTGSSYSNGSGDFAIAFSTSPEVRSRFAETAPRPHQLLPTDAVSPLFEAALE